VSLARSRPVEARAGCTGCTRPDSDLALAGGAIISPADELR